MIRKSLLTSLGLCLAVAASAAPITPEQALQRASIGGPMKARGLTNRAQLVHTAKVGEMASAYVFQNTGGGFVILSADDVAYPVLGYSDSGSFNTENMPPQMKWWLEQYGEQINAAAKAAPVNSAPTDVTDPSWTAIEPLIKTQWNQGEPYYNDCPLISTGRCYTGCVATSMAQIMNYFKYPEVGRGEIEFTKAPAGRLYMDFSAQGFDWDNMLDTYLPGQYNEVQAAAVAYLMKACGYSVEMGYNTTSSGAVSALLAGTFVEHFDYDPGISYKLRVNYSTTEWTRMVYENLKNIGPVIYDGMDPTNGGHSFICDGYDGNGYFHFNWGWSGLSDGYFSLNALNPDALGTGGGAGGGFNDGQGVLFGIQKPTGKPAPEETRLLDMDGALFVNRTSGNVIYLGLRGMASPNWCNNTSTTYNAEFGVKVVSDNGGAGEYVSGNIGGYNQITLPPGNFWHYLDPTGGNSNRTLRITLPKTLADGSYKLIAVSRDANTANPEWVEMRTPYGYPNYVNIEKKNGVVTATSVDYATLSANSVNFLSTLYYNCNTRIEAEVSNKSTYEVTNAISVALLSGNNIRFKSGRTKVNVLPGKTATVDWQTSFTRVSGSGSISKDTEFTCALYNETTGEIIEKLGTVVMKPNPGEPVMQLRSFTLRDCERVKEDIMGSQQNIYLVENPSDMIADITFKLTSGYFASQVIAGIYEQNLENAGTANVVIGQIFSEDLFMEKNDEVSLEVPIYFPQAEEGKIYYVAFGYKVGTQLRNFPMLRFRVKTTGIEGVEADNANVPAEYYNLQGVRIENPQPGTMVIERRGSKTSKKIFK